MIPEPSASVLIGEMRCAESLMGRPLCAGLGQGPGLHGGNVDRRWVAFLLSN